MQNTVLKQHHSSLNRSHPVTPTLSWDLYSPSSKGRMPFNNFLSHDAFSNSVQSLPKAESFKGSAFGALCLRWDAHEMNPWVEMWMSHEVFTPWWRFYTMVKVLHRASYMFTRRAVPLGTLCSISAFLQSCPGLTKKMGNPVCFHSSLPISEQIIYNADFSSLTMAS